jgi:hypothetical protein
MPQAREDTDVVPPIMHKTISPEAKVWHDIR